MNDKRIPIIIDTDPGVDDIIAIMLAAATDSLDIVGITPVDGNVPAEYTFRNALDLRDFLGLTCPVAKGAQTQLVKPFPRRRDSRTHGSTGTGAVVLPAAKGGYSELAAWDFIYETAKQYDGQLQIVAVGPLTNLARMLQKYPDAGQYIKEIDIMGGGVGIGNVTPYAEFNFWVDPPAAKVVFESGIPIVMAGLDVTLKTGISYAFISKLAQDKPFIGGMLDRLVNSYTDAGDNKDGESASPVHDAIPMLYVANPAACTTRRCRIDINAVEGDAHWGESVADFEHEAAFNTTLITDVDMRVYEAWYEQMAARFEHLGDAK